jgi:hypothetical protein
VVLGSVQQRLQLHLTVVAVLVGSRAAQRDLVAV